MIAVVFLPSSVFVVPVWIQGVLVIGGLGVSAVLSGWLPRRPKLQRLVTAAALACVLAASVVAATHVRAARVQRSDLIIDCEWFPWSLECWLLR